MSLIMAFSNIWHAFNYLCLSLVSVLAIRKFRWTCWFAVLTCFRHAMRHITNMSLRIFLICLSGFNAAFWLQSFCILLLIIVNSKLLWGIYLSRIYKSAIYSFCVNYYLIECGSWYKINVFRLHERDLMCTKPYVLCQNKVLLKQSIEILGSKWNRVCLKDHKWKIP